MLTESVTPTSSVMSGLFDRKGLAADLRCSERTIIRRERAGMPFIKMGMLRLYEPAKVREWLISHEHRPATPVRGRPRKHAA